MITEKVTSFIPDAIREAGNTIAAAIQGGGGGSVEWSQIVTTGTKIAIITINGESTEVYAPTGGGGGSTVSWNEIQTTGTKIAQITIDGTTYDVYAPNVSASDVSYDNTASGLTADDVQEAVDELAGDLSTLSGTVSGHTSDIGNLQTAVASKASQSMIAPVETSTTASQAYAVGEQFILNGTLYTATAAITAGGTIVIDGNCTASDTVTEQINASPSYTYLGETNQGGWNAKTVPNLNQFKYIFIVICSGTTDRTTYLVPLSYFKTKNNISNYIGGYTYVTSSLVIGYGAFYSSDTQIYLNMSNTSYDIKVYGVK